jgi:hypothetical protein
MQARTYHESQDKPTYVIREIRESDTRTVGESSESRIRVKRFQ